MASAACKPSPSNARSCSNVCIRFRAHRRPAILHLHTVRYLSHAGADVEFDPAYFALEKLAQGTPESVMGDEVKPAAEPDFRKM